MARVSKDVLGAIVDFLRQNNGVFTGSVYSLARKLDIGSPSVYMAVKKLNSKSIVKSSGNGDLILYPCFLSGDDWRWRKINRQDNGQVGKGKPLTQKVAKPNLKNFIGREDILKELADSLLNLTSAQEEVFKLQGTVKEQGKTIRRLETVNEGLREEAHRGDLELKDKMGEVAQLDLQVKGLLTSTRRNAAAIRKFDSSGIMIVPGE